MEADTLNSKLEFLNQIMDNEFGQNSNKDIIEENKEVEELQNETNEETGNTEEEYPNANNDDSNEQQNPSRLSGSNSLNESMNADDRSNLSFFENEDQPINDDTKTGLTETVLKKANTKRDKVKKTVIINANASHNGIKNFYSANNSLLYSIPAHAFSQFETMLFDLVGFAPLSSFKLENIKQEESNNIVNKLEEFNSIENSASIITDMNVLNENLTNNVFRRAKLKDLKPNKIKTINKSVSAKTDELTVDLRVKKFKSKMVTVILNQFNHESGIRRRACRFLLEKRNTFSMDVVLNEISNLFKVESSNIRRIFSLQGNQVCFFETTILI